MNFATGLFTRTKYKNDMNGVNYDSWLNSNNPYDLADEEEREREYHLEQIEGLDEEEIEDYLFAERIEDPRKK
jgi:plasmid maintenance system antidote protein VapI